VRCSEIGLSLVDSEPKELLYLSVSRVNFTYSKCEDNLVLYKLAIGDLQLDNQILEATYPVVIARHPSSHQHKGDEVPDFVSFYALQDSTFTSIDYWRKFHIRLCEFDIKLDDATVLELLNFANFNFGGEQEEEFVRNATDTERHPYNDNTAEAIMNPNMTVIKRSNGALRRGDAEVVSESDNATTDATSATTESLLSAPSQSLSEQPAPIADSAAAATTTTTTTTTTTNSSTVAPITSTTSTTTTTAAIPSNLVTNTLHTSSSSSSSSSSSGGDGNDVDEIHVSAANMAIIGDNRKVFFDTLTIGELEVNVTFSLTGQYSEDTSVVLKLLGGLGATVANIDMAPIRLSAMNEKHVAGNSAKVMSILTEYYSKAVIGEMYKLVGSFEILGNPVSLVRHLGTGFRDFAAEPGLHGTSLLLKNSVIGISGSIGNITNSIGTGASQLSWDSDYIRKREAAKREQPKHILDGLHKGAKELGSSILSGFSGVIHQPTHSSSIIAGVGKGLMGLAIKPAVGFADLATRTAQGIQNSYVLRSKRERERERESERTRERDD
jgi:hypothetical protein